MRPVDTFKYHRRMRAFDTSPIVSNSARVRIFAAGETSVKEGSIARFTAVRGTVIDAICSFRVNAVSAGGTADLSGEVVKTIDFPAGVTQVDFEFRTVNRSGTQGDRRLTVFATNPVNCKIDAGYTEAYMTIQDKVTSPGTFASGLRWRSGADMASDGDATQMRNFGNWRGRALDVSTCFIGLDYCTPTDTTKGIVGKRPTAWKNSYATRRNGNLESIKNSGRRGILAIPLTVGDDAHLFTKVKNSDEYKNAYQQVANEIKAIYGTASSADIVYVRIGWEANKGYYWSFDAGSQLDDYVPAFNMAANIIKNTCPNVMVVWNELKEGTNNGVRFYPGNSTVDVISIDLYDNGWMGGYMNTEAKFQNQKGYYTPSTKAHRGWLGFYQFALAMGRPLAVDEWGCSTYKDGYVATNPTNNSFFNGRMFQWFSDMADDGNPVEYENYFNGAVANRILNPDGSIPPVTANAAASYRAAYIP